MIENACLQIRIERHDSVNIKGSLTEASGKAPSLPSLHSLFSQNARARGLSTAHLYKSSHTPAETVPTCHYHHTLRLSTSRACNMVSPLPIVKSRSFGTRLEQRGFLALPYDVKHLVYSQLILGRLRDSTRKGKNEGSGFMLSCKQAYEDAFGEEHARVTGVLCDLKSATYEASFGPIIPPLEGVTRFEHIQIITLVISPTLLVPVKPQHIDIALHPFPFTMEPLLNLRLNSLTILCLHHDHPFGMFEKEDLHYHLGWLLFTFADIITMSSK